MMAQSADGSELFPMRDSFDVSQAWIRAHRRFEAGDIPAMDSRPGAIDILPPGVEFRPSTQWRSTIELDTGENLDDYERRMAGPVMPPSRPPKPPPPSNITIGPPPLSLPTRAALWTTAGIMAGFALRSWVELWLWLL